jgi:hypothetical protein
MVENDEPIPPEYYLNGPDEFVNPNESTSSQEDKERIEKDAIRYEDKNPYDAIHSAYFMGAITEHRRNAALRQSIAELTKFLEGFTKGIEPKTFKELSYLDEIKSAIERAKALIK